MSTEPHAVIFLTACPECGVNAFNVITIPKLATGEYFPIVGECEACGVKRGLRGEPPFRAKAGDQGDER